MESRVGAVLVRHYCGDWRSDDGDMCTWKDVKTIGKKMNVKRELDEMEVKVGGENAKPDEQEVENQKQDEQKKEVIAESKQQAMNTESTTPAPEYNQEVSISI